MKQALPLHALLFFTTRLHAQEDLPASDGRAIVAEVKAMMSGFNEGKADLHPHLPRPVRLQEIRAGKAIS